MVRLNLLGFLVLSLRVILDASSASAQSNVVLPPLVPAVHSFQPASHGSFQLSGSLSILVDENFASSTVDSGLTLIPPPLESFAQTFAADLQEMFPRLSTKVSIVNEATLKKFSDFVFLTISPQSNYTLASGQSTTEGYEMDVSSTGVKIIGGGAKGAFWGTRTLLQGFALSRGQFPNGVVRDQPDWQTRGIMLGRQFTASLDHSRFMIDFRHWKMLADTGILFHFSRKYARMRHGSK